MDPFLSVDEPTHRPWTAVPRLRSQLDIAPAADAPDRPSPERLLMWAVLQQAFLDVGRGDLVGRPGRGLAGGRVAMLEAIRWFASPDRGHPYAFHSICDVLDLDPREIRVLLRSSRRTFRVHRKAA